MKISDRPAGGWIPSVRLEGRGGAPLFARITRSIVDDVRRGRLEAGDPLPSSRELARMLGVHRNTVLAAYRDLSAQGWIETVAGRGTFVCKALPPEASRSARAPQTPTRPAEPGFRWKPPEQRFALGTLAPGLLPISLGVPDVRLAPAAELARAYGRVMRRRAPALLQYAEPRGHPRLRAAVAAMLKATRGMTASGAQILVTRGSQMGLHLIAQCLVRPGDRVVVETLGYSMAWEAYRAAGARLVPVRVDADGLDVERLADVLGKHPVRAVHVTPHHQFPTTVTMSAARRVALLELARRHRFAIIEDDYDHDYHYEGRPVWPLASTDHGGLVLYVGTFSKLLAPGIRIGFVAGPERCIDALARLRSHIDRQGDFSLEAAVAELLEEGEVQRHAGRARRIYRARRDHMARLLGESLAGTLSFRLPAGGVALWARAARGVDVEAWARRAADREKLAMLTARHYAIDGRPRPFVRLGFAALDEPEIDRAVAGLSKSLPRRPRS